MIYPLVRDLAADGIPVKVTCRVLGFSPQAFYKWRANPVRRPGLVRRAPGRRRPGHPRRRSGLRLPVHRRRAAAEHGITASENRVQRLCRAARDRLGDLKAARQGSEARSGGARRPGAPRVHRLGCPTSCGSPTSPSTPPTRASSTCARSRTCSPAGSSATRSTPG